MPVCPNVAQKAAAPAAQPKPAAAPKKEESPKKAATPAAAATPVTTPSEGDHTKVKKDKKRNKKNKKDASHSPDTASSAGAVEPTTPVAKEQPATPVTPTTPAASTPAEVAETSAKEQSNKKKAKKNKKNKATGQETAAAAVPVDATPTTTRATNTNPSAAAPIKPNKLALTDTTNTTSTSATTNNKLLVQQENAKNLKEKENLAHKLSDNITEELSKMSSFPAQCTLASEISKARQHIKNSLERMDGIAALAASPGAELLDRLSTVEKENEKLRSVIDGLNNLVIDLHARVKALESGSAPAAAAKPAPAPAKAPAPAAAAAADDDEEEDDDVDLFGSEDEEDDKAAAELREKRLAEYAAKKSKKPALIAKSNIILDIKPWDDETDMKQMELEVRKISCDGLLLGASKLVPLAYGIHKLQLSCVIEDDKVSVDWLQEEIEKIEDFVQSVDIAAFNKI